MQHGPFRRTQLIVDPKLQWSLCAQCLWYGLLLLLLIGAGLFGPLILGLSEQAPNASQQADLASVMLYMHGQFWWVALVGFLLVALGALRFSHRIAGPLVRVKRHLRVMSQGKLPAELRTREHDFLKEEVACLNAAAEGMAQRFVELQSLHAALHRELVHAHDATRQAQPVDLHAALQLAGKLQHLLAAVERVTDGAAAPVAVAVVPAAVGEVS